MKEKIAIYGAKSIALGVCRAFQLIYPEKEMLGFLVSDKKDNPVWLAGFPVMEIAMFDKKIANRAEVLVVIGTPEEVHGQIIKTLLRYGFNRYMCIDWKKEEKLMEEYYKKLNIFPSIHSLVKERKENSEQVPIKVYMAKSHVDKKLKNTYEKKEWIKSLQAGAELINVRVGEYQDNVGEHISNRNGNYCELTALYWIWKNQLDICDSGYCGLFQYRRWLHLEDDDLAQLGNHQIDVVLPFPTIHEPGAFEHPLRYINQLDWNAMSMALNELYPEYAKAFPEVMNQEYLYNYNILLAKRSVLADYCEWLFPILRRTEELSTPKGWERDDRYIGYLGENLLTLFFMYHKKDYNIFHTGRKMLL